MYHRTRCSKMGASIRKISDDALVTAFLFFFFSFEIGILGQVGKAALEFIGWCLSEKRRRRWLKTNVVAKDYRPFSKLVFWSNR